MEAYPEHWLHGQIHIDPTTGEVHCDKDEGAGDFVRRLIEKVASKAYMQTHVEAMKKVGRWFSSLPDDKAAKHQEALDELVHDLNSKTASKINNQGSAEQIEYVFEQLDGDALKELSATFDHWEW